MLKNTEIIIKGFVFVFITSKLVSKNEKNIYSDLQIIFSFMGI